MYQKIQFFKKELEFGLARIDVPDPIRCTDKTRATVTPNSLSFLNGNHDILRIDLIYFAFFWDALTLVFFKEINLYCFLGDIERNLYCY